MSNDELLRYIAEHMVTKADIAGMATKDDIKDMATRDDLKDLVTKDELKNLATKDELKNLATKDELKNLATKDELRALEAKMATKDDLRETENMILTEVDRIQERSEEHYAEICTRIRNLENKVVVRSEQSTINLLVEVVSTLKTDVEYLKAKIS